MNVLLFGASGMLGQGVLRECLLDPEVTLVRSIGRSRSGVQHPKFEERVFPDLFASASNDADLTGFDACFFCLGVSSTGMKEEDYERITYGLTIAVARTLARLNPRMTFIYVSGQGTDTSEKGRVAWARIKGRTENELLRLFPNAYAFRPGAVVPVHGETSRTGWYRVLYKITGPLLPLLRRMFPSQVLTTEEFGRAMLVIARRGYPKHVLETADIRAALL